MLSKTSHQTSRVFITVDEDTVQFCRPNAYTFAINKQDIPDVIEMLQAVVKETGGVMKKDKTGSFVVFSGKFDAARQALDKFQAAAEEVETTLTAAGINIDVEITMKDK